jgi:hypothetical protein
MCDCRKGLSFGQSFFIVIGTIIALAIGVETQTVPIDYASRVERAFDEYKPAKVEPACGKPIIVGETPLVNYSREFLDAAAKEAEAVETRAPHLMQLIADYRTLRRAERAH